MDLDLGGSPCGTAYVACHVDLDLDGSPCGVAYVACHVDLDLGGNPCGARRGFGLRWQSMCHGLLWHATWIWIYVTVHVACQVAF